MLAAALGAEPLCGDVRVIAIDGPSGAGKSTLADAVASDLDCPVMRLDLLYPGWEGLADGVRLLVDQVLAPLSHGHRAHFRVWDWAAGAWGAERHLDPSRYLVVEGCGATTGAAGAFASVRVWLDAPEDVRRMRALARDGETYAPWWERWAAQERALFTADHTREHAELVLDEPDGP